MLPSAATHQADRGDGAAKIIGLIVVISPQTAGKVDKRGNVPNGS